MALGEHLVGEAPVPRSGQGPVRERSQDHAAELDGADLTGIAEGRSSLHERAHLVAITIEQRDRQPRPQEPVPRLGVLVRTSAARSSQLGTGLRHIATTGQQVRSSQMAPGGPDTTGVAWCGSEDLIRQPPTPRKYGCVGQVLASPAA